MAATDKHDPLGRQPSPVHGDAEPNYGDRLRGERVARVLPFFKKNYIEHKPQEDLVEQLLTYVASTLPLLGGPIDARGLAQLSNAGKSRMIDRFVDVAAKRRAEAGLDPNPLQILVFELDRTSGMMKVYRQILRKMGDDFADDKRASIEELEERIHHVGRKLGVEAIVGDEVQHLARKTTTSEHVTDRMKTFLNRGILPLILVGDEVAEGFFKENSKLASRLGHPLQLKPLDVRNSARDMKLFLDFCTALDESMVQAGIVDAPANLAGPGIRSQLVAVSGGHIGRVCRLACEATQHALWRGSPMVERHDLSFATRGFARHLNWTTRDPFSTITTAGGSGVAK